jgi:hypothetical protein
MATQITSEKNNWAGSDRGFNQRFVLNPSVGTDLGGVYVIDDADDLLSTLNTINSNQTISRGEIRVVSGGHCYENFVFQNVDDGPQAKYIMDLSTMSNLSVETLKGTDFIVVEPGANNMKMQKVLHSKFGLTLPGGSCYSVCAGGHIAGGGYGLLSRLHGLTVDYLSGVEIIVHDGKDFVKRLFDPTNDSFSLDWASRGGGAGHFGIITKYYFEKSRLQQSPESALFITIPVPWAQFTTASFFHKFLMDFHLACSSLPFQAFVVGKMVFKVSETSDIILTAQVVYGKGSGHNAINNSDLTVTEFTRDDAKSAISNFMATLSAYIENTEELEAREIQSINLPGHPIKGAFTINQTYDLPWIDMSQLLNGSGENQKGKYKSSYMADGHTFEKNESFAIYDFLTDKSSLPNNVDISQTLIQMDSYGGQINLIDTESDESYTAIAARNSVLKLQYQTYWKTLDEDIPTEVADDENIISWFNKGYNSIYQATIEENFPDWTSGKYQGCYFNYPDRQLGVNSGYTTSELENASQSFEEAYFGTSVVNKLKTIKRNVDTANIFSFSQSITSN